MNGCTANWLTKTNQPSGTAKPPKQEATWVGRSMKGHKRSKAYLTLSGKVVGCQTCLVFIRLHQGLDIHTSMYSSLVSATKSQTLTVWCVEQWHICTFLLPLCNHTNCFHIWLLGSFPAHKTVWRDPYLKVQSDGRHIWLFWSSGIMTSLWFELHWVSKETNRKDFRTDAAFKRNLWECADGW